LTKYAKKRLVLLRMIRGDDDAKYRNKNLGWINKEV